MFCELFCSFNSFFRQTDGVIFYFIIYECNCDIFIICLIPQCFSPLYWISVYQSYSWSAGWLYGFLHIPTTRGSGHLLLHNYPNVLYVKCRSSVMKVECDSQANSCWSPNQCFLSTCWSHNFLLGVLSNIVRRVQSLCPKAEECYCLPRGNRMDACILVCIFRNPTCSQSSKVLRLYWNPTMK